MVSRSDQQGTGKHPHKDTEEPYPHRQADGSHKATSRSHEAERERSGGDDLKAREYRDKQGQEHHHTKSYMEQHKKD